MRKEVRKTRKSEGNKSAALVNERRKRKKNALGREAEYWNRREKARVGVSNIILVAYIVEGIMSLAAASYERYEVDRRRPRDYDKLDCGVREVVEFLRDSPRAAS